MSDDDGFVVAQTRRLEDLCAALEADDWALAARLSAEVEGALLQRPPVALTVVELETLGSRHANYLRCLIAARQRLEETSDRMSGVRRAMQAYAHLNGQD